MKKEHIIKIPHLKVNVVVRKKEKGDIDASAAYTRRVCAGEYEIVTALPIKGPISAGHLVHEIIHVIQHIVDDHNMSFSYEREHTAYLAGYLFDEISKL